MQVTSGTRIGGYEVVEPLGAGGMGNVYRASDRRLGRDVAIKTLPENLARDPAALARFEREARFLASLNHPNIATIYGIEEADGERFLILELVPGTTLEGPIRVDDAVRIAIDIASGLEAAHEAGIVHRDLKPSNIRITPDGRVKMLDFGIAKQLSASDGVTIEKNLTLEGSLIGTPAYMSPEQIRGGEVDRRADIWAFGCVLYEMLTGKRAFQGRTFMEVADAIQNREPDWNALPSETPPQARHVLTRCLKKDPRERLHDIADARLELVESSRPSLRRGGLVSAIVDAVRKKRPSSEPPPATALKLRQITFAAGVEEFPAWSADGQSIVWCRDVGGIRKLWMKRIDSGEEQQLTHQYHDDLQPACSRDGQRILFVRAREPKRRLEPGDVFGMYEPNSGDLWSIDLGARRESHMVEGAFNPSISPDGRSIVVDASWGGPRRIWILDERGHNPQQITSDSSEAVVHILPRWSPDGTKIVYQRIERTKFDISVVELGTRKSTAVTNDLYQDLNPVWARSGRSILFSSYRSGGMNIWRIPVSGPGTPTGAPQQLTIGAGQDVQIAISPDGRRLAYATLRQNADIWRIPLAPEGAVDGPPEAMVATTREDSRGAWSPNGDFIAFNSDRTGDMNIWIHSLRDRNTRQITRGAGGDFQPNWSPDGRQLVFFSSREGDADIWKVDIGSGRLTQLTRGRSLDINPFFSPDGSAIVYQSDSSGRLELWVMRSDGSRPLQRTEVGVSGHFQRWLGDGLIYFRSPANNALMRVGPASGDAQPVVALAPGAGAHLSFSPDATKFIDVVRHKVLWMYDLHGAGTKLFEFPEPDARIDYPVWSPDGRWLMFDRFKPEGGDVWIADGIE